jgi:hypothetical protein
VKLLRTFAAQTEALQRYSGRHPPNSICRGRAGRLRHGGTGRGNRRGFFLCADLGITPETRDDHAAYIASWLKVLKDDKRAIFTAASHAQKAADYLHGLQSREAQS